jgi:succinate dehydrogenase/fumarate reductase iron-sulfur protein
MTQSTSTPTATLRVRRFESNVHGQRWDSFQVPLADRTTVLDALFYVLRRYDRTLAFRCACRAAMCGSCGMVINGSEALACRTSLSSVARSGVVRVEPLRNLPVVKDLVVDTDPFFEKYQAIDPFVVPNASMTAPAKIPPDDRKRQLIDQGLDCITCGACYSACPMVAIDPDYLGPAQLLRAFNVLEDVREAEGGWQLRAEVFGRHGVWRCHAISECTRVCPKALDPSRAIRRLKRRGLPSGSS